MKYDVAILIVTYNSAGQIEVCLRSIAENTIRSKYRIIVVDNASQDETIQIIQSKFPHVELICPGANLGFSKGVNLAAKNADADYLLLLNPDTEIVNNAIDSIWEFARQHKHYGFYGGRTLSPKGTLEPSSCWGRPTLWSMFTFSLGLSTLFRENPIFDPESLGAWKRDSIREVGVITGCFLLVEREAWKTVNGLDERYFMYGEDVDLSIKAWKHGFRPVIYPGAEIIHEIGKSSAKPTGKMMLLYKGKACLVRSHWSGITMQIGLGLLLLGVAVRAFPSWVNSLFKSNSTPERWLALWRQRNEWLSGYTRH